MTKGLSSRSHLQRIFVMFIRVFSYIFLLDVKVKKDTEKEQVTEDMLKDITEVFISETDTFSLLDMPSSFVSVDADEAEATMWVKCFPYLTGWDAYIWTWTVPLTRYDFTSFSQRKKPSVREGLQEQSEQG